MNKNNSIHYLDQEKNVIIVTDLICVLYLYKANLPHLPGKVAKL